MGSEQTTRRAVDGVRRRARRAVLALVAVVAVVGGSGMVVDGQVQPAQEEFVPLADVPMDDRLPAAPLLVAAYGVIWIAVFVYLWSIWRRMMTVERELTQLARRTEE